ncbi:MAG: metallophosphoesterase [Planctomycetaceae bacterium]|jgi:predicted phosphodiesterase|nr:metallophosphoesterase [Planctomycetaceae bacterium]
MPITFPPIKRREFLTGTFTAGLLAVLSPKNIFANEPDVKRTNVDHWVFLSDTHVPGDPNKTHASGQNPNENFIAVREEILKLTDKPKGIIVTGDFAHLEGKPEDYARLVTLTAPYTEKDIPVHVALGNHDHLNRFFAAFTQFKKENPPVRNKNATILETQNCNLFIMDSLFQEERGSGYLGRSQRDWLAKELDARKEKPALLFAHHNPEDLVDIQHFWYVVKPRKQVKAYIYGHTHVYQQSIRDDVHLINLPALGWEFQQGKQPLGWSDVLLSENGIQLTLNTTDKKHPKNNDVRQFTWLR